MAHGHPDNWEYSSPQLPVPGPEQTLWSEEDMRNILAGGNANLIAWPVPAGERLYVTSGHVSCSMPGTNQWSVREAGAIGTVMYFDTAQNLPLNPSAMVPFEAGQTVVLQCWNLLGVAANFGVSLWGFRVNFVPGTELAVGAEAGLGLLVEGSGL